MAIETASKVGTYYIVVLFAVALAATEAWVMPHVLLQRLRMVIEMSSDGGAFTRRCRLYYLT